MTLRLAGKTALISGVSDGIGGAIARSFAAEGANVACTGIQMEFVRDIAADVRAAGTEALALPLDVREEDDWQAAIDETVSVLGGLDIVVNNAGVLLLAAIADTSLDKFREVYAVNVEGTFIGLQQSIAAMRPGGTAGKGGSIINISSASALGATTEHVAYGSSKAAVLSMARHAASECAAGKTGIRVNSICPGVVKTGMLVDTPENLKKCTEAHPLGLGDKKDIAAAALYLASDESRWVTGTELTVDGGLAVRS